jgi:hypothetical protein
MIRRSDWEQQLANYLADCAGSEFVWGKLDCALFAAGAVRAMTDFDPAAAFRGKYRSVAGSVRALRLYGEGTLEATIASMFPDRPIGFARRGDLVLHTGAVGVCVGDAGMFIGQEGDAPGLVRVPRAEWTHAWGVGE